MKRWLTLIVVALVVVAVPLLSAQKGDVAAGKTMYAKKCGTCHGPAGETKPAIAKMMKVEMRDLSAKEVQDKSDADLKKVMTAGEGKMKPVTGMTDKDVNDILAFVRSLKK